MPVLLCVTSLAEHLGLHELLERFAGNTVSYIWHMRMDSIASIVDLYYKTKRDVKALLHHPTRGAYSELEVLELLELAKIPDSDILNMLELELMGPAEINILLAILVDQNHADRTSLLRKTVKHQLQGVVQYHNSNGFRTYIVEKVAMPSADKPEINIPLPESMLQLSLKWTRGQGKVNTNAGSVRPHVLAILHLCTTRAVLKWHCHSLQMTLA